eukprot:449229-Prorocentrum_minimum.AAC.2
MGLTTRSWRKQGVNMHKKIHLITIGVRATVPVQNDEDGVEGPGCVREKKPEEPAAGPSMDVGQTRGHYNCAIP